MSSATTKTSDPGSKVLLYCPTSCDEKFVKAIISRGYSATPLTDNNKDFWDGVCSVKNGGSLVLYSHGDSDGPLMIAGTEGEDMTGKDIEYLGERLRTQQLTFYCLSCNTGKDPFLTALLNASWGAPTFFAPAGYTVVSNVGGESIQLHACEDEEGKQMSCWVEVKDGTVVPWRKGKQLTIR